MKWLPVEGEQAAGVAKRSKLPPDAQNKLVQSSAEILGKGINPKAGPGSATGLVVGHVQSGKTLSFTTAIGLARDNEFPLVIVIAGNKDNLLTQSHERLERDLDVNGGEGLPAWKMEKNPRAQESQFEQLIRQAIDNWQDPTRDADEKSTLLLTVLKQNQRLASLTALLRKMNLQNVPALLIDDEADQASLNTKVQRGEESTTYTRLRELREALPCHTFLQYTATPQAPLLINIADNLSPDFVHVLEPGDGYVGGAAFFAPNSPYIKIIPPGDLLQPNAPLPTEPPPSLLDAMRVYFVGLAASLISKSGRRSMLIHPARERAAHQAAAGWASAAKDEWANALSAGESDLDRIEVIRDFREAYAELQVTESGLPSFDEIIQKLPRALRNTTVIEFNTRGRPKTPEINWRHAEGWILVGGQAVDRGFTVDSLTVTYMPRGMGMGNADTLQQRARFFGYARARGYFGICRVYLEQTLRVSYEDYVEHEELMRSELRRVAEKGESLRTWRRRFILDPSLKPCRRSVISDPYTRGSMAGGWTRQIGTIVDSEIRDANMRLMNKLMSELNLVDDTSYPARSAAQQHQVDRDVPLQRIFDTLVEYSFEDPRDTASFMGLLMTLAEGLRQDKNATAAVYRMRPNAPGERKVKNAGGEIDQFQQGPTRTAGGGRNYPGDASFAAPDKVSLQFHVFDLTLGGSPFASSVPLITVNVPTPLAAAWLVQVQSGQQGTS
ncbi:Z1 domain-containing protein [Bradyrhizobium sp. CCGUVB1N3]|uniref:Z1 domain-containing protein n=1 Tax=Bradyrhizobium sp. CCGUVB1N3 TaxID=2949629 RepID=UPI0020B3F07E|nr:Z1 domain-containing protein [Bradyrhizobium sp. CCGUVB1N3]MCP3475055.1 Z1 domain-containing protein [Bradyrhizobium sp. CCGUVB1N3]